jgi:hypothetical protein
MSIRNIIARILLVSDLHELSVPVGKQKGQGAKWWQWLGEWVIFNPFKWWNNAFVIPRFIKKISYLSEGHLPRYHAQIVDGDLIECEYNERGMVMRNDCWKMRDCLDKLRLFSRSEKMYAVAGDHELGYRLPLSSDPFGGISCASVNNFLHYAGPLWQTFSFGDVYFILLSSSLMIQGLEHLSEKQRLKILQMREEQRIFFLATLSKIPKEKMVFVFMHDPDAISVLNVYICKHPWNCNKNITIFCGHMHAEFSLKIYKFLGKIAHSCWASVLPIKIRAWAAVNNVRLTLFKKYNLQIIPAPSGMMGIGGGFKVLNIYNDGTYEIEKHKI